MKRILTLTFIVLIPQMFIGQAFAQNKQLVVCRTTNNSCAPDTQGETKYCVLQLEIGKLLGRCKYENNECKCVKGK